MLSPCLLLQHLPGRTIAGQSGTIGQALVCILGAAATSSNGLADIGDSAGQAADQTEAATNLHPDPEDPASRDDGIRQPSLGQSVGRFVHEGKASKHAHAEDPREHASCSSNAPHLDGIKVDVPSSASIADSAAAPGVHSPISLADGVADMHAEADADCAQSHAASHVRHEPDTCVLFRPPAQHAKAGGGSWVPGRHAPARHADAMPERLIMPEGQRIGSARKPDGAKGSTGCALGGRADGSKADRSATEAGGAEGTAVRLFSPVEAVKAISRVHSDTHDEPKHAPQTSVTSMSSGAVPQAMAHSQTGLRQRAQRYSKVHAVDAQQPSQSPASSSFQAVHAEPEHVGMENTTAGADLGHVIPLSSMISSAGVAAELAQQTRRASAGTGKENHLPDPSPAAFASSAREKACQTGGAFSVQDNPLSAMEPSPEVLAHLSFSHYALQFAFLSWTSLMDVLSKTSIGRMVKTCLIQTHQNHL